MSAPSGVKSARWNQAVNKIVTEMSWTSAVADAWLNDVWDAMFQGDEVANQMAAHARLRLFLETNRPDAHTLPRAFYLWATT